jgi:hypothetical protein
LKEALLFLKKNRDARREAKRLFYSGAWVVAAAALFGGLKPTLGTRGVVRPQPQAQSHKSFLVHFFKKELLA